MPETDDAADRLIRVPIGFPPELHEWLREQAFHRRTAMAEIVREAVQAHRDRLQPQLGLPFGEASAALE